MSDPRDFIAALPASAEQDGPGLFIAVVGPSGSGKDSLIDHLRHSHAGNDAVCFVRRAITRPASAGGERHDAVTELQFAAMRDAGAFALSWQAHGLSYGVPAEADAWVRDGRVVIANLSRSVLREAMARYPRFVAVHVQADASVLAERLDARGREDEAAIANRLSRRSGLDIPRGRVFEIDNSGRLEDAGARFRALVDAAIATSLP